MEIPWTLFRKAALVLFGISLLAGFVSTALFMGHRLPVETWRIIFILALVVLTITSTMLIPGVLLPNITSPHPEFLTDDLEDEWTELRQRTVSRPHLLLLGGVISALIYSGSSSTTENRRMRSGSAGCRSASRPSVSPS